MDHIQNIHVTLRPQSQNRTRFQPKRLRIVQKIHLRIDLLFLFRVQFRLREFPILKFIQLHFVGQLLFPLFQGPVRCLKLCHALKLPAILLQQRTNIIKPIQNQCMILLFQQQLVIMLTMQIYKVISHLFQHRDSYRRVVHECPASIFTNLPPQNDLITLLNF